MVEMVNPTKSLFVVLFIALLACHAVSLVCATSERRQARIQGVVWKPSDRLNQSDALQAGVRRIRNSLLVIRCGAGDPSKKIWVKKTDTTKPSAILKQQTSSSGSKTKVSAWIDGLRSGAASGLAAACVKTLLQPLDAVKTLQQFQQTSATPPLSTLAAARILMNRKGGIANFYAGLGVTVVGSMPGVAIYFGIYQYCKRIFLQDTEWGTNHPRVGIALAAAIGNTVASMSRTPYEVVKQKLQMGTYETFGAAVSAVLANPMDSLFPKGGVLIQMIRDVPYAVVTLLVYETLQETLRARQKRSGSTEIDPKMQAWRKKQWDFFIGGFAGGVGSWVTNPMDVLKTRLQTDTANVYGGSVMKCTSMVWQEGGAPAFLRGAVPRLMHKVPANCFFFLFYEMFRRLLRQSGESGEEPEKAKTLKR